jgi:hypothetical protein
VNYSREELDWVEAEWAFHLHGRTAFMSREDFLQLQAWAGEDIPAEVIVNAMEAYFQRRAKRPPSRSFVALSHLAKDVAKALKVHAALAKAGPGAGDAKGWEGVREPLRSDPRARALFEAWKRLEAQAPSPDSPGFLDHFDLQRKAFRELTAHAESRLGADGEALRRALAQRLAESNLLEGTLVWKRAWDHHWSKRVCEAWGIPL